MARTSKTPYLSLIITAMLFAPLIAGCGPSEKDLKIQDLTAEVEQLKGELADRDQSLNDALVREDDARDTIDELNRQMAKIRVEKDTVTDIDGWLSTPNFDMISVPGELLFASGKATLTSRGRSKLSQIAADLRSRYSDRDIYIFGHTDSEPIRKSKWKDNWELGAQRSLAVVRTLNSMGIPYDSIVQANCGEHRPKVSGGNRKNQAQNRRVEFFAVPRDTGSTQDTTAWRNDAE